MIDYAGQVRIPYKQAFVAPKTRVGYVTRVRVVREGEVLRVFVNDMKNPVVSSATDDSDYDGLRIGLSGGVDASGYASGISYLLVATQGGAAQKSEVVSPISETSPKSEDKGPKSKDGPKPVLKKDPQSKGP